MLIKCTHALSVCGINKLQGVLKKRLPFEVKRQCRMFEFECLNSLMSPGMRKTLELGIFMLTLRINLRIFGLIGDLKH